VLDTILLLKQTEMKKLVFNFSIILIFLSQQWTYSQINSSRELIKSMKSRYSNKWYPNLTFKQKTSFYQNDTLQREETWYEAMKMPEGLVVKIGSMSSGNGFVFKKDSMFVFRDGIAVNKMKRVHDLLILGFSVYFDVPKETIDKLKFSGFDLSYFKDSGDFYLIGNPDKKQACIEKKRLLFSKIESIGPHGGKLITEFNNYQKLGKAWIAPEVLFYRNGQLYMKEEYYDINIPKKLPDNLFNINEFESISW
jgi:hypothetical protein